MSTINVDSVVVRSSEVMASAVDKELVMMDLQRGMYYGLDGIGADIWERLAQPVRVSDLCDQLVQEYDVDRATCAQDVTAFLLELLEQELVTMRG